MRQSILNLVAILLVCLGGLIFPLNVCAQAGDTPTSMDDSFAALVIGDLPGLVQGIAGIVNQVMPGMGAMIPAQAGGFLGDPQLEGFGAGDGVAAIVFPGELRVIFAEVKPEKQEAYIQKANSMGLQAGSADGILVLSEKPVGVEVGKKIAGEVKEALLTENPRPSLHVLVHVPKILETYQTEVDAFMGSFPEMMKSGMAKGSTPSVDTEGVSRILEAEVYAIYNLLSEVEILELELTPASEGLSLELSMMPDKGTNLHRLITTARGGDTGDMVQKVPADGAIRMQAAYDGQAVLQFLEAETEKVLDQVEWTEEEEKSLQDWTTPYFKFYGDGVVGSMMGESGSKSFLNGYVLCKVENPEEALKFFKEMSSQFDDSGFSNFYKSMGLGMKIDYQEGVQEYKGVRVDRMVMNVEADDSNPSVDPDLDAAMKTFSNMKYDLAIVDGYLAYTMGDSSIETLIDLVQKGGDTSIPSLAARQHFGEGGSYYGDLNVVGYLQLVASIMENLPKEDAKVDQFMKQFDSIQAALAGAPPISSGLFADREQVKAKLFVPSGLLQKISQAVMGAMMAGASGGN